jgi:hypothetical protein
MSAFISDTSLMAIVNFMASKHLTPDECAAMEECYRVLEGRETWFKSDKKPETPEEAAEREAGRFCKGPVTREESFLAGVRWAEERGRK